MAESTNRFTQLTQPEEMTLPESVKKSLCILMILGSNAFSGETPELPVETGKWYYFVLPQYTKETPKIRINPKEPFMCVKVLEIRGNWVMANSYIDKQSAMLACLLESAESDDSTLFDDYLEFSKMTKDELANKLSSVSIDDIKVAKQWINLSLVQIIADFAPPKMVAGQDGADKPVTAPDSSREGKGNPQPEAEGNSR